jgi:hypothetical protein
VSLDPRELILGLYSREILRDAVQCTHLAQRGRCDLDLGFAGTALVNRAFTVDALPFSLGNLHDI